MVLKIEIPKGHKKSAEKSFQSVQIESSEML